MCGRETCLPFFGLGGGRESGWEATPFAAFVAADPFLFLGCLGCCCGGGLWVGGWVGGLKWIHSSAWAAAAVEEEEVCKWMGWWVGELRE